MLGEGGGGEAVGRETQGLSRLFCSGEKHPDPPIMEVEIGRGALCLRDVLHHIHGLGPSQTLEPSEIGEYLLQLAEHKQAGSYRLCARWSGVDWTPHLSPQDNSLLAPQPQWPELVGAGRRLPSLYR